MMASGFANFKTPLLIIFGDSDELTRFGRAVGAYLVREVVHGQLTEPRPLGIRGMSSLGQPAAYQDLV